jgi:tetratricopeptide (TPR) repeat protein
MKSKIVSIILITLVINSLAAQNIPANAEIKLMLMRGEYTKAMDTCKQILTYDSLNPEIHYYMGLAYQNTLEEDSAISCFYRAVSIDPGNKAYSFSLAKGYYGKEKYKLAEPFLIKLCSVDSMNWVYAYYLTSIYMHSDKFDEAIGIYKKFLKKDSLNTVYIDKMAFAYLKKEDFITAIDLYNESLSINCRDLTAIKNLAYLYSVTIKSDTAIILLGRGMGIDSSDMDLYIRRAALNYSKHYTKRALDDYMVVLSSGDSSIMYLKRIGIGYSNNLQPNEAIRFLLKAYKKDSSDYETCSYLGQSYYKLKDMKNSIYYYNRVIKILTPVSVQLGLTYILTAESQKGNGLYQEAIASYMKAQELKPDPNLYMIIGNIYDETLNDREKAIYYYQKFLDNLKNSRTNFTPEYIDTVKQRLAFLKAESLKQKEKGLKI